MPGPARVFFALPVPERVARRLGEEADRLRLAGARVRWVPPANYHVSLRFVGEVPETALPELGHLLEEEGAGTGALRLVARGLGWFPQGSRRPRVLWCGVTGESAEETDMLGVLHGRLDRRLKDLGYRPEKGRFHPHVTLGRVRGPERVRELTERMGPGARREFGRFTAREAVLFESTRGERGPVYAPLQRIRLG